jgi:hypothetical protein
LLRTHQTGGNIPGTVDDEQVRRAGHVIELGDGARIRFAVADLRPADALLGDEGPHLGRLVIEGYAHNLEAARPVFRVKLFE